MSYDDPGLKALVGKNITRVEMSEDHLVFHAGDETFVYDVEGDCCSHSYFYDFCGAENLVRNGPVTEVEEIDLGEPQDANALQGDSVVAYGFRLITKNQSWGDQSAVVSFRNDSNGYYGGWMSGPVDGALRESQVDALVDISTKDWFVVQ